jgi:hypothetical protein
MSRRNNRPPWRGLLFSLLASACLLLLLFWLQGGVRAGFLADRLAVPVARILAFVGAGLVVGEVVEAAGWTRYLALLASPLFRFARLGPRCGAAFTSAFFSGVAANTILMSHYAEDRITREQLFLTNFINHLPAFFLHLPTTVLVVLPLAGPAGGIYLALVFAAILLRTGLFLLYGRLRLPQRKGEEAIDPSPEEAEPRSARDILARLRGKLPARYVRIVQFVLPIYIGVYLLKVAGFFDLFRGWLSDTALAAVLPVESLSMVVIAFLADYTSGFATAGALLNNGVLDLKQGVLAIVLGNVLAFPFRTLRHQLPRYLGVFTPKMGTQILLAGQSARIASLLLVAGLYYALV